MKLYEPLYASPSRQLVPEYNDASGNAHQRNVGTSHRPDPEVQLKQVRMQLQPLGLLQPLFPPAQFVIHAFESRLRYPKVL